MPESDPENVPNPLCDTMGRDENLQANLKYLDKRVQNLSKEELPYVRLRPGDSHDFTGEDMPCPGIYQLNQKDIDTFCQQYPSSALCTLYEKPPQTQENSSFNISSSFRTLQEYQQELITFPPLTVNVPGRGEMVITSILDDFALESPTKLDLSASPGAIGVSLDSLENDSVTELKGIITRLIKDGNLSSELITRTLEQLPGSELLAPLLKELPKLSGSEFDFKLKDWQKPPSSSKKGPKQKTSIKTLQLPELKKIKIGPFSDIVGMILEKAEIIIEALIFQTLKTSLSLVLQTIMDSASEATSDALAGASNLKNALAAAVGAPGQSAEQLNDGINSILSGLNAFAGTMQKPSSEAVGDFINKVSDTLTNDEAKSLMRGEPTPAVLEYISEILETSCPEINGSVQSHTDITNLFGGLGSVIPAPILDVFLGSPSENLPFNPDLCDNPNDLEKFDNIRSAILENKGLTPDQINHQLANAKARKRQTLNDLNNILSALPDIQIPEGDPNCPDPSISPLSERDPAIEAATHEIFGNMYDIVNISFTSELVNKRGLLNMILSDVRGCGYKWHNSFYIRFLGEEVPSEMGWFDFFANTQGDRENDALPKIAPVLGVYPDTVAIYLKNKLANFSPIFKSTTDTTINSLTQISTKEPDLSLKYDDWDEVKSKNNPFMSGDIRYYVNIDYDHFKLTQDGQPKPGNDFKIKITNLFDEEGFIYEGERPVAPIVHDYINSLYSTISPFSIESEGEIPHLEYSPQATAFGKMVQSIWSPNIENDTSLTGLQEYCMTTMFNSIQSAILRKFAKKISENAKAFNYGYNENSAPTIKFLDDYEKYGGNEKMRPFYVDSPPYGGWLAIYEALLSEGNEDEDRRPIIDFNDISQKINKFNNKINDDPRLEADPASVIEPPYSRILEKDAAASIEGSILAIVRLYIVDNFIKGMPVFSLFESKSPENFDEVLFGYMAELILDDILDQGREASWLKPRIRKETFYYKFLEQVVQNFGRKIEKKMVVPTPTEQYALDQINYIMQTWKEPTGTFKKRKKQKEFDKYMTATQDYAKIIFRSYVREELTEVSRLFKKALNPSIHNLVDLTFGSPSWMLGAITDDGPRDVFKSPDPVTKLFDTTSLFTAASIENRPDGYFPFVLEKYIKIERYSPDELPTNYAAPHQLLKNSPINQTDSLTTVMNIEEWQDFIAAQEESADASSFRLGDVWKEWSFGLRISFMLPTGYIPPQIPTLKPGVPDALKSFIFVGGSEGQLTFPLVSVEKSISPDQPISSAIMGEYDSDVVTCLINEMIKTPEYQTLFDYCFPLPSLLSLVTIYTIEGFLPSLGQEWGEDYKDNGGKSGGKNLSQFKRWDKVTFKETKRLLRGTFSANYHVRDLDYLDPEIPTALEEARKRLKVKTKLPKIINDKGKQKTMPWWMRKMLRPKPPKGEI